MTDFHITFDFDLISMVERFYFLGSRGQHFYFSIFGRQNIYLDKLQAPQNDMAVPLSNDICHLILAPIDAMLWLSQS